MVLSCCPAFHNCCALTLAKEGLVTEKPIAALQPAEACCGGADPAHIEVSFRRVQCPVIVPVLDFDVLGAHCVQQFLQVSLG